MKKSVQLAIFSAIFLFFLFFTVLNYSSTPYEISSQHEQIVSRYRYDVTGDGKKENIFITIGIGCGSCHGNWVYIYSRNKQLFEVDADDVSIAQAPSNKGFFLIEPVRKINEPSCCASEYKTTSYVWNGSQFIRK